MYSQLKWHFGHSTDYRFAIGISNSKNFHLGHLS
ncbi:hypothetical protein DCAR_0833014 [Daucus carota subsp. sativus]|uniref:Uncharacterized protein n=1 Tax=Daucus carota subsp. sativus TaxID=79200 RepID=A0AAF1BBG3_DAUCS|nr:hypothetical protein DCAR_0833014 [Daucus carota subsp. sativus]